MKKRKNTFRPILTVASGALLLLQIGCRDNPPQKERTAGTSNTPIAPLQEIKPATDTAEQSDTALQLPPPVTLVSLKESAYGKSLAVFDSTVYLLTQSALWQFAPNQQPVQTPLNLGYEPAITRTKVVYWSSGALFRSPLTGGKPTEIVAVEKNPFKIFATDTYTGWLERDAKDIFTFFAMKGAKPQTLYRTSRAISSPVSRPDSICFVEKLSTDGWRIGRLYPGGTQKPEFSPVHSQRVPSMIVAEEPGIYYYDLPTRSVRLISADLQTEQTIATNLVCSPLAVSDRLLCAQVEGVFEVLLRDGGTTNVLTTEPMGLVTTIAASSKLVAWLNDTGENELSLRFVPLKSLPAPRPAKGLSRIR